MPTTTVKDVMTTGPTSIANDAMVVEAARRMLAEDVGSLPGALAAFLLMPASAQQFSAAEIAAMKADYKRPPPRPVENKALVDLGRLLFWDPRASASGKTACVSCHLPHLGWAVTDARSRNDSGKLTSRKSPDAARHRPHAADCRTAGTGATSHSKRRPSRRSPPARCRCAKPTRR